MRQAINSSIPQTMIMLRQNPIFPSAFLDETQKRVSERLNSMDLMELLVPVYAKNFTLEELRQILAFEQSPVG